MKSSKNKEENSNDNTSDIKPPTDLKQSPKKL